MIDGPELYDIHYNAMAEIANCSIEKWDDLPEEEHAVWEAMAEEVSTKLAERMNEE